MSCLALRRHVGSSGRVLNSGIMWSELSFSKILPAVGCILGDGKTQIKHAAALLDMTSRTPESPQTKAFRLLRVHRTFKLLLHVWLSDSCQVSVSSPFLAEPAKLGWMPLPWSRVSWFTCPMRWFKFLEGCAHSLFITALVPCTGLSMRMRSRKTFWKEEQMVHRNGSPPLRVGVYEARPHQINSFYCFYQNT